MNLNHWKGKKEKNAFQMFVGRFRMCSIIICGLASAAQACHDQLLFSPPWINLGSVFFHTYGPTIEGGTFQNCRGKKFAHLNITLKGGRLCLHNQQCLNANWDEARNIFFPPSNFWVFREFTTVSREILFRGSEDGHISEEIFLLFLWSKWFFCPVWILPASAYS